MHRLNQTHSYPLDCWLPTGQAARALGCSPDTLKRYIKRDGFLQEGEHLRRGPHRQSPIVWNVPACQKAIEQQGRLRSRMAGG